MGGGSTGGGSGPIGGGSGGSGPLGNFHAPTGYGGATGGGPMMGGSAGGGQLTGGSLGGGSSGSKLDVQYIIKKCPETMHCMTTCPLGYRLGGQGKDGCPLCTCLGKQGETMQGLPHQNTLNGLGNLPKGKTKGKIEPSGQKEKLSKFSLLILIVFFFYLIYINLHHFTFKNFS